MFFPLYPQSRNDVFLFQRNPQLANAELWKKHCIQFLSLHRRDRLVYALMSMINAQGAAASPAKPIKPLTIEILCTATWTDSETVCCFANGERHLGHIVKADDSWLAFDATHLSERGTGFRLLGCCTTITLAKYAVEQVFRKDCGITPTHH
jgi:hypothetical protein